MERTVDNLCVDRAIMLTWSPSVSFLLTKHHNDDQLQGGFRNTKYFWTGGKGLTTTTAVGTLSVTQLLSK